MKKFKPNPLITFKNIGLVVLGTLILSFGTSVFLLPFNLVTGGIPGLSLVISNLITIEWLTVDIIVTILTWSLYLIGFIAIGKSFAAKTLISALVYPVGVSIFMRLASSDFLNGFFDLSSHAHTQLALILASVMSGIFVGVGCALSFLGGGSTGGVDVIALVICKIFKRLKRSTVMFIVDASIVVLGMFAIGDFILSLLGIMSAFIAAYMIDKVFIGSTRSFIAQIITDEYESINKEILEKVDRGSTIIEIVGGYSGEPKKMLMVSFTVNQYAEILNIVNRHDKNAFMTIHRAHEINGEGWTR